MLIDLLSATLKKSHALDEAWQKMDAHEDAVIGVASSARPFLVAARFVEDPRTTLVVTAGEDAADTFARTVGAFVGEERVLRYADCEGNPFSLDTPPQPRLHGLRLEALWALQNEKPVIVVASARALLRKIASPQSGLARPLILIRETYPIPSAVISLVTSLMKSADSYPLQDKRSLRFPRLKYIQYVNSKAIAPLSVAHSVVLEKALQPIKKCESFSNILKMIRKIFLMS